MSIIALCGPAENYTNITIKGAGREQVVDATAALGLTAFVSPTVGDVVVVYEKECESLEGVVLAQVTLALSNALSCPGWGVLQFSDDVVAYCLAAGGEIGDVFESNPDLFETAWPDSVTAPNTGNARLLCAAFNLPDARPGVEALLKQIRAADDCKGEVSAEQIQMLIEELAGHLKPPKHSAAAKKLQKAAEQGIGYIEIAMLDVRVKLIQAGLSEQDAMAVISQHIPAFTGGYWGAIEAHGKLLEALNLPCIGLGYGYNALIAGEFPPDFDEADFIEVCTKFGVIPRLKLPR